MPNWCECDLSFRMIEGGSQEDYENDLKGFIKYNKQFYEDNPDSEILEFEPYIPYPSEYVEKDRIRSEMEKQGVPWNEMPKDGFNDGGYEWCIQNWGTKWGPSRVRHRWIPAVWYGPGLRGFLRKLKHRIRPSKKDYIWSEKIWKCGLTFDTAWAPPSPVIQKMSEMFPNIRFILEYYEAGMEFRGTAVFETGVLLAEESVQYYGDRGG